METFAKGLKPVLNKTVVKDLSTIAKIALKEDIGDGDISAALILDKPAKAKIITRQQGIYCGDLWIEALQQHIHPNFSTLAIHPQKKDGQSYHANDTLLTIKGNLRQLLSIERTILNGLQLLCGIATKTHQFVEKIKDLDCHILDTRKTIPGWRRAQKYAVHTGGAKNHRMGLYDAYLLKENHQLSDQNALQLIAKARQANKHDNKNYDICIEVESIEELETALPAQPTQILLDNFSIPQLTQAVKIKNQQKSPSLLEASGNIDLHNIRQVAETGINCISIGALTKNIQATDLSMRLL
jgi:nicotinate-nucleotide pyrophosphorylase (carboxylating)